MTDESAQTDESAMTDEFDVVARWTAEAVAELGPEFAMPAGCRGSGSPDAMRWLGRAIGLAPGRLLLDDGAGVGGPSAFAAAEFGARPVPAEPMAGACRAARALFDLPAVIADGGCLPFRDGVFPVAWSLGVLCTMPDQPAALTELRRVLAPGASLGLLVYLRQVAELTDPPEGNDFPTAERLEQLLLGAGFAMTVQAELADFADAPADWQGRADRVTDLVARRHGSDSRWQVAEQQQQKMGALLGSGQVAGLLTVAVAR